MREIIKDRAVVNDDWAALRPEKGIVPEMVEVPAGKFIGPLAVWQA